MPTSAVARVMERMIMGWLIHWSQTHRCDAEASGGGRRSRGRGRGRRGRRRDDEEEDSGVMTLEQWEARNAGRDPAQVHRPLHHQTVCDVPACDPQVQHKSRK